MCFRLAQPQLLLRPCQRVLLGLGPGLRQGPGLGLGQGQGGSTRLGCKISTHS